MTLKQMKKKIRVKPSKKSSKKYSFIKNKLSNIKKEKDGKFLYNGTGVSVGPDQPGYSEAWKKAVSRDAGGKLKVIEN